MLQYQDSKPTNKQTLHTQNIQHQAQNQELEENKQNPEERKSKRSKQERKKKAKPLKDW